MTEDEIPADFSELPREDIKACLSFAAAREAQAVHLRRVKLLLDDRTRVTKPVRVLPFVP